MPADDAGIWVALRAAQDLEDAQAAVVAALEAPAADAVALQDAAADLAPAPPLSPARIARLEALTAQWTRDVRSGGPMPEDTLLCAAPKPPPPPPSSRRPIERETIAAALENDRCGICGSVEHFREDHPTPVQDGIARAIDRERERVATPAPRVVRDWNSRHDPRSRDFDVAALLRSSVPPLPRLWPIGPVFDQGTTPPLSLRDASGCVGMATAAAANVLALAQRHADDMANRVGAGLPDLLSQVDALALYDRAQDLDDVPGKAGPGTSVLAGMLAGREAGLWARFLWAFGTRQIAQAISQIGPVVIGVPWGPSLEDPDAAGVIAPAGAMTQGHALALVGFERTAGGPWFVAQQSRGAGVGAGGLVRIHHRHLSQMLAGVGEAAVPIPAGL